MTKTKELEREYAMRFARTAQYRFGAWSILIRDFFSKWIPENSVILDLGFGWGGFIKQVTADRKIGIDLNPASRNKLVQGVTVFFARLLGDVAHRRRTSGRRLH